MSILSVLSAADFMPRIQCGQWDSFHLTLYIAASASIFIAYMLIPIGMIIGKQSYIAFSKEGWLLFVTFIALCGGGHFLDNVMAFWWPAYRLFAWWHLFTAIVSWCAVGYVWAHVIWKAAK